MRQFDNNEYLSDEELMKLIDEVESEELVEAPEYLMADIMSKITDKQPEKLQEMPSGLSEPKLAGINKPPREQVAGIAKTRNKQKELVTYGFKVMLSAAASIAILLAVPTVGTAATDTQQTETTNQQVEKNQKDNPLDGAINFMNQTTDNICGFLNKSTTKIVTYQGGNNND